MKASHYCVVATDSTIYHYFTVLHFESMSKAVQ